MFDRALNLVRYRLGEFLLRGALQRVLVMIGFVLGAALLGGWVAFWLDGGFDRPEDAVWWAFLRLSDPGYLGDDQGTVRRSVSLALTVAGYVLFMGAMVAIMTQWLHQTVRKLESGLTPIAARGHVVIAGWTDRTVSILREMFFETPRRTSLWARRGGRQLAVVLAENASPELHQTLRDRMGDRWREQQIILREGEPIYLHHLRRVDFANAAAILLPGDPFQEEGNADSDVRILKSIASIGRYTLPVESDAARPFLVAELFDSRRAPVARRMYDGPMALVCSDRLMAGLFAQGLRYPRLLPAVAELLFAADHDRLRILEPPEGLVSRPFFEVVQSIDGGCVVGVVRDGVPVVCPDPLQRVEDGDLLAVYGPSDTIWQRSAVDLVPAQVSRPVGVVSLERVLILGWTRRVPALIAALGDRDATLAIEVVSKVPAAEREQDLHEVWVPEGGITHHLGDFTIPEVLGRLDLRAFDAVLLVGSDRLESGSESDARSLAGLAALRTLVPASDDLHVVVELMDAENIPVVEELRAEYLVMTMVVGRLLAQVALTPPLGELFDDVFVGGGGEMVVVPAHQYGGAETPEALRRAVLEAGHLPLGVLEQSGTLLPFEEASADDCGWVVMVHRVADPPH